MTITLESPKRLRQALQGAQSHMLGQATADLQRGPARWMQQEWGVADIHTRQKWSALWPCLANLPDHGIRLLDAGCGTGRWSLELASLFPYWSVTGIDYDIKALEEAEYGRCRLWLPNVMFAHADFMQYSPRETYDAVLSVASAHYLAKAGLGRRLFAKFNEWLSREGVLLLYAPRRSEDAPLVPYLNGLSGDWGFTAEQLYKWSEAAGLRVESIVPQVGRMGTAAKQIAITAGHSLAARATTYPLQLLLNWMDERFGGNENARSSAWLLIATKARRRD